MYFLPFSASHSISSSPRQSLIYCLFRFYYSRHFIWKKMTQYVVFHLTLFFFLNLCYSRYQFLIPFFFFTIKITLYGYFSFYLYSSINANLSFFYLLVILSNALMSTYICFVWRWFHFLGCIPFAGSCVKSVFTIWTNCQTIFQSGCAISLAQEQCLKISISPPCQHLLLPVFGYRHPSEYKVVSACGFNLYFLSGWWYWAYFHVLFGHLYIFFGEMAIHIFPFLNWVVFLLFSCKSSLYILDTATAKSL